MTTLDRRPDEEGCTCNPGWKHDPECVLVAGDPDPDEQDEEDA